MRLTARIALLALSFAGLLAIAACATQAPPSGPRLSQLPPVPSPPENPTTPEKVALGAKLWIDPRLSGSGKTPCTACHVREKGWTDGLPVILNTGEFSDDG